MITSPVTAMPPVIPCAMRAIRESSGSPVIRQSAPTFLPRRPRVSSVSRHQEDKERRRSPLIKAPCDRQ